MDDDSLVQLKYRLIKKLVKKGVAKQKINAVLNFIQYYWSFEDPEKFIKFEKLVLSTNQSMG